MKAFGHSPSEKEAENMIVGNLGKIVAGSLVVIALVYHLKK